MSFQKVPERIELAKNRNLQTDVQRLFLWCLTAQFCLRSFNPFAPEPPVTARADPGPFYPL